MFSRVFRVNATSSEGMSICQPGTLLADKVRLGSSLQLLGIGLELHGHAPRRLARAGFSWK